MPDVLLLLTTTTVLSGDDEAKALQAQKKILRWQKHFIES